MAPSDKPVLLGITGATGSVYGIETARILVRQNIPVEAVLTGQGRKVMAFETGRSWEEWSKEIDGGRGLLTSCGLDDLHSPMASGSYLTAGMVVAPCSMGTLGRIAGGISSNLLERAADVTLKERRPLILLARETPLNAIHLRNMLAVTEAGGCIMPPVPSFYTKPDSLGDMVAQTVFRVLDLLGLEPGSIRRWDGRMEKR